MVREKAVTLKLALATVPIFQFMPPDELRKLSAIGKIVEKNKGDLILLRDETVPGIFLVGEGVAGVHATKPERLIAELKAGESFGEMSYLENAKASATIRAEERATKLILFLRQDLRLLLDSDPLIGRFLFQGIALQLSKKLRTTTDKLAQELKAENDVLRELAATSDAAKESMSLVTQIAEFHQQLNTQVDNGLKALEELAKRIPEKQGSLNELNHIFAELRSKAKAALPRIETQVGSVTRVLARLGEIVAGP